MCAESDCNEKKDDDNKFTSFAEREAQCILVEVGPLRGNTKSKPVLIIVSNASVFSSHDSLHPTRRPRSTSSR